MESGGRACENMALNTAGAASCADRRTPPPSPPRATMTRSTTASSGTSMAVTYSGSASVHQSSDTKASSAAQLRFSGASGNTGAAAHAAARPSSRSRGRQHAQQGSLSPPAREQARQSGAESLRDGARRFARRARSGAGRRGPGRERAPSAVANTAPDASSAAGWRRRCAQVAMAPRSTRTMAVRRSFSTISFHTVLLRRARGAGRVLEP